MATRDCKYVSDYVDGQLSSRSQLEFESHLETCAECRTRLDLHERLIRNRSLHVSTPNFHLLEHVQYYQAIKRAVQRLGEQEGASFYSVLGQFTRYFHECRSVFVRFINHLVDNPIPKDKRDYIRCVLKEWHPRLRLVAFLEKTEDIISDDVCSWLDDQSTKISEIVTNSDRELYLAIVDPDKVMPQRRFEAFWLIVNPSMHFIVVSRKRQDEALAEAICHEIDHQRVTQFDPRLDGDPRRPPQDEAPPRDPEVDTTKRRSDTYESFASAQSQTARKEKKLIATKVAHDIPLKHGSAIVVDAGSTCLELWYSIVDLIESKRFIHSIVYTNSLSLLAHWSKYSDNYQLRITTVELFCTRLDAEHLAFYNSESNPKEAEEKLLRKDFRAMNVYIGTSGIQFDANGGILFGYHAGPQEKEIKELLFKCNAERRIILAAPSKVGFVGARMFDILQIKGLCLTPIDLVTTTPRKGSAEEKMFEEAKQILSSRTMERAIAKRGLVFRWIIIDRETGVEEECISVPRI